MDFLSFILSVFASLLASILFELFKHARSISKKIKHLTTGVSQYLIQRKNAFRKGYAVYKETLRQNSNNADYNEIALVLKKIDLGGHAPSLKNSGFIPGSYRRTIIIPRNHDLDIDLLYYHKHK